MDLTKLAELLDLATDWEAQATDMAGLEAAIAPHVPVAAVTARGRARQLTDCAQDLRDYISKQVGA